MLKRLTKRYSISELQAGMIVAELVSSDSGSAILSEGSVLTENMIRLLAHWGIERISISLEELSGKPNNVLPWTFDRQNFLDYYTETVDIVKTAFKSISLFGEVPVSKMQELANQRIDPLLEAPGVFNHLLMIRHTDDYTFEHSVNVAILSGILGKWMGISGGVLRDLIFAALLHDVGKSQIPPEILNKPGKLSPNEMGIMRTHTTKGYYLLKELPNVPETALFGVLQHHERNDGSGYPLRLQSGQIHEFAKIIAVVDIYDAMTSDRVYRRKETPYFAVEAINSLMYSELDPWVCSNFLHNVRDYMTGNLVLLSDGREAEIVYTGKFPIARPLVRTAEGQFIDLETNRQVGIVELLSA